MDCSNFLTQTLKPQIFTNPETGVRETVTKGGLSDVFIRPQFDVSVEEIHDWAVNGDKHSEYLTSQPYFISCSLPIAYETNPEKYGSNLARNPLLTTISTAILGYTSSLNRFSTVKYLNEKYGLKFDACLTGKWLIWPPCAKNATDYKKNKRFTKFMLQVFVNRQNSTSKQFANRIAATDRENKEDIKSGSLDPTQHHMTTDVRKALDKHAYRYLHNPKLNGDLQRLKDIMNGIDLKKAREEASNGNNSNYLLIKKRSRNQSASHATKKKETPEGELGVDIYEEETESEFEDNDSRLNQFKIDKDEDGNILPQDPYQQVARTFNDNIMINSTNGMATIKQNFRFDPIHSDMNNYSCCIVSYIDILDSDRREYADFLKDFPLAKGLMKVSCFAKNAEECKEINEQLLTPRYKKVFVHNVLGLRGFAPFPPNKKFFSNIVTSSKTTGDLFMSSYYQGSKLAERDVNDLDLEQELKKYEEKLKVEPTEDEMGDDYYGKKGNKVVKMGITYDMVEKLNLPAIQTTPTMNTIENMKEVIRNPLEVAQQKDVDMQ